MPDRLTPERRSALMSRVRQQDTDIELAVRSRLHRRGLRFRKHVKTLPGRPDVVFTRAKLAIFVHGDFWHGYRYEEKEATMSPYWRAKIARNMERDAENVAALQNLGWTVLSFWQHQIKRDPDSVVDLIAAAYSTLCPKETERGRPTP